MGPQEMTVGIVSIIYYEPEWKQTERCIKSLNLPTVFVDRNGVGSLSKAYNKGFDRLIELNPNLTYVWMISNVTFKNDMLSKLVKEMNRGWDGLHPSFHSDHEHTRPRLKGGTEECTFFEFTSPIIRTSVFNEIKLDEQMPYFGQDFDWGYRVRQAGYKIGINYDTFVKHEYIRFAAKNKKNPITLERQRLRKETNESTKNRLVEKYGPQWAYLLDAKNYQGRN